MKTLLNVASGSKNLFPASYSFGGSTAYLIHHVDKEFTAEADAKQSLLVLADAGKLLPFGNATMDVILAISPYGLATINQETLRVLKPGGGIVVVGSSRNPFVKARVAEAGSAASMVNELAPDADAELSQIGTFLKDNYPSYATGGAHPTRLDLVRVWRKP